MYCFGYIYIYIYIYIVDKYLGYFECSFIRARGQIMLITMKFSRRHSRDLRRSIFLEGVGWSLHVDYYPRAISDLSCFFCHEVTAICLSLLSSPLTTSTGIFQRFVQIIRRQYMINIHQYFVVMRVMLCIHRRDIMHTRS